MITKRYPGIWSIFTGSKYRHVALFLFVLIPNVVAALLEGVSFALILAALSVLSAHPIPWLPAFFLEQKNAFLFLVIFAVGAQAVRSAVCAIALYANTVLSLRLQEEAQRLIYQKIFQLSYRCVSEYKIGDLAEYAKTPAVIINVIMDNANKFLVSSLMIVSTLLFMFALNASLALFTLAMLVVTGGLHKAIIRIISRSSEQLSDCIVDSSKQALHALQSMRTLHTFNRQEYAYGKIQQILEKMIQASKKVYFWNNFIPSINERLGIFFVSMILLTGTWILSDEPNGALPALITFIALTHRLAIRIQMGNSALGTIVTHQGSISRLEGILSDEGKEFSPKRGLPLNTFPSEIHLQEVSLTYPGSTEPAIDHLSLQIPKGKTIAFVGASGSGKSSLIDLILRLYEPTTGSIHIDGKPLIDFSIGSWRDHLGVVSQDISIFNDTIEENILFGMTATPSEMVQAANLAGLDTFIQTLPHGYQTIVGERGFRLSGGQRQRLALARALVRNPAMIILDEATSSLDSKSEFLIQTALETIRKNRTILIVAHRLSTIRDADYIYVLEKGRIVEEGTHLRLLEQQGLYEQFWQRQTEAIRQ